MKTKILLSVIMSTVLLLVPCAFSQQAGQDPHALAGFQNALRHDEFMVDVAVPSATASQATEVEKVNVHQLSWKVEQLIMTVEHFPLACETRNAVVRRLRKLDDALLSGRRSAARAMALAWAGHAWSLQSARVLGARVGSVVQTQLGAMADQIGTGWPVKPGPTKHWKPLPSCESRGTKHWEPLPGRQSADTVGSYTPDVAMHTSADIEELIKGLAMMVPKVGHVLSALVGMLWPASGEDNAFQQLVSATVYDLVEADLQGLENIMAGSPGSWQNLISSWQDDCETYGQDSQTCINEANETLWTNFQIINTFFIDHRADFQVNGNTDYRLDLLPLYAQYENLYLAFLRDGVLLHNDYWAKAGVDIHNLPRKSMDDELNPDFVYRGVADRGIGYVNSIYRMGLDTNADNWITRNAYVRDMTLKVLDFRDTWKYLDPEAYPEGVPGGVKLTRMIYSDPVGDPKATPRSSSNVPGPLKELSLWTRPTGWNYPKTWISSVQATTPPTVGPATSGNIEGDQAQLKNSVHYFDLSTRGPIVKVLGEVSRIENSKEAPNALRFTFADGSESTVGDWVETDSTHSYDGEVLATAQSVSTYIEDCGRPDCSVKSVDSIVLGFRYANSFAPSGEAIGVGSGKCLDLPSWAEGTQAIIHSCGNPLTASQIWYYDPGLKELYATNLTDGSRHCVDAEGGGTTSGTPVVISACQDSGIFSGAGVSSQQWTLEAVGAGIGKITNVKSGLVVDVPSTADGTGLQLMPYVVGDSAQQWKLPSPLTGEIHGIGSGRCVDVPGGSTTAGTQVQIYDCNGTLAQQWTYDPTSKALRYAKSPPMCLDARGGGTTAGTAVQIYDCNGTAAQQWTLLYSSNTISNDKSGLFLDAAGGGTANGTLVQLWTGNGNQAQLWSRTSTQGGAVHAVGAGKCLHLPSWNNGTQAVIYHCYDTPLQEWTYRQVPQTFTVNSPSGPKCLDASGTANGAKAVINDCTGAASQRWSLDYGNKTITNVASGLVLDVTGGATADWTGLQLMPYVVDDTAQKWVWPLS